jgi:hypothetical protein
MRGSGALQGSAISISTSSARFNALGVLAGKTESISLSSAQLGTFVPPSGPLTIFIVSPQQPVTRRQDYVGGKFWQRRVGPGEQTIRMP